MSSFTISLSALAFMACANTEGGPARADDGEIGAVSSSAIHVVGFQEPWSGALLDGMLEPRNGAVLESNNIAAPLSSASINRRRCGNALLFNSARTRSRLLFGIPSDSGVSPAALLAFTAAFSSNSSFTTMQWPCSATT
jgi:hypothetical protein